MLFEELPAWGALFLGLMTLVIGILAMLFPRPMSAKFGIPLNGPGLPYVVAAGVRDVFIGVTVFVLWRLQLWQALGWISCAMAPVAVTDAMMVLRHGQKRYAWVHAAGAAGVMGYGLWLLFLR